MTNYTAIGPCGHRYSDPLAWRFWRIFKDGKLANIESTVVSPSSGMRDASGTHRIAHLTVFRYTRHTTMHRNAKCRAALPGGKAASCNVQSQRLI